MPRYKYGGKCKWCGHRLFIVLIEKKDAVNHTCDFCSNETILKLRKK